MTALCPELPAKDSRVGPSSAPSNRWSGKASWKSAGTEARSGSDRLPDSPCSATIFGEFPKRAKRTEPLPHRRSRDGPGSRRDSAEKGRHGSRRGQRSEGPPSPRIQRRSERPQLETVPDRPADERCSSRPQGSRGDMPPPPRESRDPRLRDCNREVRPPRAVGTKGTFRRNRGSVRGGLAPASDRPT